MARLSRNGSGSQADIVTRASGLSLPLPGLDEKSLVQFATSLSYAEEEDDVDQDGGNEHTIFIVRSGALHTMCSVDWFTEPTHKLAGVKFKATRETVTFMPNEYLKKVQLTIMANRSYDSVVEVGVILDNAENCNIFQRMKTSRVKIIDYDVFPTDKFEAQTLADRSTQSWKHGKDLTMLIEVCKLLYSHNRRGAMKIMLADTMENLISIGRMELGRQMIATLVSDDGTLQELIIIASALVLSNVFMHSSKYFRQFWKLGGAARKILLLALMERFLYFEEVSRDMVDTSQFRLTFAEESFTLVSNGYVKLFALMKALCQVILIAVYFQLLAVQTFVESDGQNFALFLTFVPIAVVPLILRFWVGARLEGTDHARRKTVGAKVDLIQHMTNCVQNYALIQAYSGRPFALGQCQEKINTLNGSMVKQASRTANDEAMFDWLSVIVESTVVLGGGCLVLSDQMVLGTFTALLRGINSCMGQYKAVYAIFSDMQSTYPAVWQAVTFINYKTDLKERFDKQMQDMNTWEKLVAERRSSVPSDHRPIDSMPITLKNIDFRYSYDEVMPLTKKTSDSYTELGVSVEDARFDVDGQSQALKVLKVHDGGLVSAFNEKHPTHTLKPGDFITGANGLMSSSERMKEEMRKSGELNLSVERAATDHPLLKLNLSIATGKLVAITGSACCGMTTLLKMIAGTLLPDPGAGEVFVPPHLRCLHVSYSQQVWRGPIGESVFFGLLTHTDNIHLHLLPKEEIQRGLLICRKMKIPDNVIEAIEDTLDDADPNAVNSQVQKDKAKDASLKAITSLSSTTVCKLQLAAALIADPQVLLISKAFNQFSLSEQENVIKLLRAFVEERGLGRDSRTKMQRRPRTCIFSSTTPLFLEHVDEVHEIQDSGELVDRTASVQAFKEDVELILPPFFMHDEPPVNRSRGGGNGLGASAGFSSHGFGDSFDCIL